MSISSVDAKINMKRTYYKLINSMRLGVYVYTCLIDCVYDLHIVHLQSKNFSHYSLTMADEEVLYRILYMTIIS